MSDLVHICFGHADHNKIGKDVEEENGHAHEEESRYVGVDKSCEFTSNQAEVSVEDKVIHCQQCIAYILEVNDIILIPFCCFWQLFHLHAFCPIRARI